MLVFDLIIAVLAVNAAALQPPARTITRVRDVGDPVIAKVLLEGKARSATFRRLADAIDATDGLVYVEFGRCGHSVRACLALTVRTVGASRVLRILVDERRRGDDLLAAIGHELQHAIEALSDPHVTSDIAVYNFFQRVAPSSKGRFETDAAIQAGSDILAELSTRTLQR